ncbi:CsbD family protein [Streptococcus himalayensis]|uniref:CsbD family protein n=1 Tax=Streptococcus himalayensis TaxID=1888195 RepID=A0A917A5R5_9STRE|nr:CsbD family protein [Streptococcus himalayensis]GGE29477.1 CsbD family protein [Streptococcus himalayensis]
MSLNLDELAGGLKEQAGKLVGDKKTEVEGAVEKVAAEAKELAGDATDKAKELVEDAKGAVEGAVEGLKNVFGK